MEECLLFVKIASRTKIKPESDTSRNTLRAQKTPKKKKLTSWDGNTANQRQVLRLRRHNLPLIFYRNYSLTQLHTYGTHSDSHRKLYEAVSFCQTKVISFIFIGCQLIYRELRPWCHRNRNTYIDKIIC